LRLKTKKGRESFLIEVKLVVNANGASVIRLDLLYALSRDNSFAGRVIGSSSSTAGGWTAGAILGWGLGVVGFFFGFLIGRLGFLLRVFWAGVSLVE
jgi:hypothetical protein